MVFQFISLKDVIVAASLMFLSYNAASCIYMLYFHPLSAFPGPNLAALSPLWKARLLYRGRIPWNFLDLHENHGPVVRTGPNSLSFSGVSAWRDIYVKPQQSNNGHVLLKNESYDGLSFSGNASARGVISERNPEKHARARKFLAPGFSMKALQEQGEGVIDPLADMLMERIEEYGQPPQGLDMHYWASCYSFDVISSLAFGQSFECLKNRELHPWVVKVLDLFKMTAVIDTLRHYPLLMRMALALTPPHIRKVKKEVYTYSRNQMQSRLENGNIHKDLFSDILSKKEDLGYNMEYLTAHSASIVLAGSDTITTTIGATLYYLLKNPHTLVQLTHDIHASFASYTDITSRSCQRAPYLKAVIQESLRIFPPISYGSPRKVPRGGAMIDGYHIPEGTEVYTSPFTCTHSPINFHEPFAFKPERWLDPQCADRKAASNPFSLGPRNCIGMNLAWVEISLVLAKLVWRFDMELVDKDLVWEEMARNYIVWTKPDLRMRFIPRKVEIPKAEMKSL